MMPLPEQPPVVGRSVVDGRREGALGARWYLGTRARALAALARWPASLRREWGEEIT